MASVAELTLLIKGKDETKAAFDSAKGNVDGLSGKMKAGLVAGAAAGGAAIVGLGVVGGKAFQDINAAQNTFQTQLGVTEQKAKDLGNVAKDVYANNFGGSVTDAAAVTSQAFQVMGDVGNDELGRIAENAFRMGDAFGGDTAEYIDAAKTLMENFGLSSDQAFDLLAEGQQKGLNRSGDFLDTIGEYSTQFANGGASAEQFFSLLETGLQGGMLGTDKAADAFKEFRVRIQDGSSTTSKALQSIGIDADALAQGMADGSITAADAFQLVTGALQKVDDENLKMQAGVALLGTQFEDLGQSGVDALSLVSGEFGKNTDAVESLDAQYDTLGNKLEGYKRKAELFLAPIAGHASQMLLPLSQMGMAFAGFAPMLGMVGKLAPAMNAAALATKASAAAQWLLNAAMLASPMILLIAGLVAAGIAIYIFRDEIMDAIGAIVDFVGPAISGVADAITGAIGGVVDWVSSNWPIIATIISGPFAPIVALATDAFGVRSALTGAVSGVLDFIRGNWPEIATLISGPFAPIVALATDAFGVRSALTGAFQAVLDFVTDIGGQMQAFLEGLWSSVLGTATSMWSSIQGTITGFATGIYDAIVGFGGDVLSFLQGLWDGVLGAATSMWVTITGAIQTGLNGIISAVTGFVSDVLGFFRALPGNIVSAMGDVGGLLVNAGKALIQGFVNGMTSIPIPNPLDMVPGAGLVGKGIGGAKGLVGLATGGPVSAGMTYLVGEKGPELFVPNAGGQIVPNDKLNALVASSMNVATTGGNLNAMWFELKAGLMAAGVSAEELDNKTEALISTLGHAQEMGLYGMDAVAIAIDGVKDVLDDATFTSDQWAQQFRKAPLEAMEAWNQLSDFTRSELVTSAALMDVWSQQGITAFEDLSLGMQQATTASAEQTSNGWTAAWRRFMPVAMEAAGVASQAASDVTAAMSDSAAQTAAAVDAAAPDAAVSAQEVGAAAALALAEGFQSVPLPELMLQGVHTAVEAILASVDLFREAGARAAHFFGTGMLSVSLPNLATGALQTMGAAQTVTLPGKAGGGHVWGGQSYLVGEKGPEVFTPGASGNITPNDKLGGGPVINVTGPITVNNNGTTKDADGTVKDLGFALAARLRGKGYMVPA